MNKTVQINGATRWRKCCEQCGVDFYGHRKQSRFCSYECRDESMRGRMLFGSVVRMCDRPGCGKTFRTAVGQRFCQGSECQWERFLERIGVDLAGAARAGRASRAGNLERLIEDQEWDASGNRELPPVSTASLDKQIDIKPNSNNPGEGSLYDVVADDASGGYW